ncbi:hypothetical protein D7Y40_02820 [Stenotrophomonas maltophilia]|jgi:hypothetical protein|uniref:hypothetical protein n=1 Tax=Stenotrophomonas TaxID=40323 RepID=UPI0015DF2BC7|nr:MULTISPECIES: hypothetical protein [Stenotrophomonas]MBA0335334.1 hypothetical protein [Stenotrophomonas maltophilia]MBA0539296.1 hypothetical protein [Stenotrophomonas maltophilia]
MNHPDALHETVLDIQDALAASPRFVVLKTPNGIRLQLQDDDGDPDTRLTIDRAMALLESALEQGRAVTLHD